MENLPTRSLASVPALTAAEMAEVDRAAIEAGIAFPRMMELAGRALARVTQRLAGGRRRVAVLAGRGHNGGGGLVAARHLATYGFRVEASIAGAREELREETARQAAVLEWMGVPVRWSASALPDADVVVDALLGYSAHGAPRGLVGDLVRAANASGRPIVALDLPTGLEPDTGEVADPCIRAAATVTLALPKRGLLAPGGHAAAGELYLAHIGLPPRVFSTPALDPGDLFAEGDIVRLV